MDYEKCNVEMDNGCTMYIPRQSCDHKGLNTPMTIVVVTL